MAGCTEGGKDEVVAWLEAQLEVKSERQLGREYNIDSSVINRNMRSLRNGKRLAGPFRKRIQKIIEQERADELHQQHLSEQAEAEELERREAIARARAAKLEAEREAKAAAAKEKADHEAAKAEAQKVADENRRWQEFDKIFLSSSADWEAKFRAAGYLEDGEMVEGDADELFDAWISKLDYVDVGVAAVALLPDDVVIWRDKTAAYFREGVPFRQRLQETAVQEGQPRPAMIGNFPSSDVYYDPLPDQIWRYGKEGVKVIAEWRELTDAYGRLGTGKLPTIVHPKTVAGFERLISIEEKSGYVFRDSRLGPDAHDRLQRLQRRAVLPAIGLTTAKMTWSACNSAAIWIAYEGVALLGVILFYVLLPVAVVLGIGWGMVQLWNWASGHWTEIGLALLIAAVLAAFVGMAYWWVKQADSGWAVVGRIGVIAGLLLAIAMGVVALVIIGSALHDLHDALQSVIRGTYVS